MRKTRNEIRNTLLLKYAIISQKGVHLEYTVLFDFFNM